MADRISGRYSLSPLVFLLTANFTISLVASTASAQPASTWQPLNQRSPLGQTAAWMQHIRQEHQGWMQPVKIEVPGGGDVSVYNGSHEPAAVVSEPALFAVNPGHTYRLRLANMPNFPEAELYPSIEVLDRLHPPAGQVHQFPIPLPFSKEEIQQALSGRLVTRVVYLEQPQIAQQIDPLRRDVPQSVHPAENVLHEADRLGRPMLIVRIGSRRPTLSHTPLLFFGTGGAVEPLVVESHDDGFVRVTNPGVEGMLSATTPGAGSSAE